MHSVLFLKTNIRDSNIENTQTFVEASKTATYILLSQYMSLIQWHHKINYFCDDTWLGYQVMDHTLI